MRAHASLPSVSNILFGLGRNAFLTKAASWTADTQKATLLTMATAAGKIGLISSSTNATPIALTMTTSVGWAPGDIIVTGGHATNTAANGTWQCGSGTTGATVNLTTRIDGVNSTGNGVGGTTGWAINLTTGSVLADVSGNSNGTDPTVSGAAAALGVANCSTISWSAALTATKVWAIVIYDNTSNNLLEFIDGCTQVYVTTQAAASATSIAVARLSAAIASGTTLVFSDGASATLSGAAAVGDTSLSVSALAAIVHRQATADVQALSTGGAGSGLPFTPAAGGSVSLVVDTGTNKLFAL